MATSFRKTTYDTELGEFERVAAQFSGESNVAFSENKKALKNFYSKSGLSELSETLWKKLENSDSYSIQNIDDIKRPSRGISHQVATEMLKMLLKNSCLAQLEPL